MTRTLTAAMQTAVAAETGYADVWLLGLTSSGGTTRITTASRDIVWGGNTYTAVGGAMTVEPPSETEDYAAQGLKMTLSGVSQTIIADLLANHMRGRACTAYFGQLNVATGVFVEDPLESFSGLLNDRWEITETRSQEGAPGTVTVSTTAVSEIARYLVRRGVRTNVQSHNDMLARAGLSVGDTFFSRVSGLIGKTVLWGRSVSKVVSGGGGGGTNDPPADNDTRIVA